MDFLTRTQNPEAMKEIYKFDDVNIFNKKPADVAEKIWQLKLHKKH